MWKMGLLFKGVGFESIICSGNDLCKLNTEANVNSNLETRNSSRVPIISTGAFQTHTKDSLAYLY